MSGTSTGSPTNRLGLTTIITGSLPRELRTPTAPSRYPVEAVFSRNPLPEEAGMLLGEEGRRFLGERGFAQVALAIADRRLIVGGTSLEQLRDGLAGVLGELLGWISDAVSAERDGELRRLREAGRAEEARQAEVDAIVETISFAEVPRAFGPALLGSSYR